MAMLGEKIDARRAEDWGLVWRAVADDALDDEVARVTKLLARTAPSAMTRIRATIDEAADRSLSDQLDVEMAHQKVLIPRNMPAAARAFLEKREPEFDGSRD